MATTHKPAGPPTSAIHTPSGGIGRRSNRQAEALSDWLRRAEGDALDHRRKLATWSLAAAGALGVVSLYQMGVLRSLPDPPLPGFDSERVDASGEAYAAGMVPDALLGAASYAVTAVLAGMGGRDRARRQPWLPLAAAAKVTVDALGAAFLTAEQISKHRKLCAWCLFAAGATAASLPHVLPEARAAWQHLRA